MVCWGQWYMEVSGMWGQWYGIPTVCGVSGLFEVIGIFEVNSMYYIVSFEPHFQTTDHTNLQRLIRTIEMANLV